MNIKIIKQEPMSMADLKDQLLKVQKKRGELNYRAQRTLTYLQDCVSLSPAKCKELREAIEKLNIPRLKEEHIVKILDVMPQTGDEVKSLLSGYMITVSQDSAKKLADAVKNFSA